MAYDDMEYGENSRAFFESGRHRKSDRFKKKQALKGRNIIVRSNALGKQKNICASPERAK